jgi:hypothetical protein
MMYMCCAFHVCVSVYVPFLLGTRNNDECCTCVALQVMCDADEAAAELARCLGPELVPKEFGGPCALPYDEYPAQKQLLQLVAKLQQQQR